MKRYRYGDPKSTKGRNRVIGQVVKFFIGWNILGYIIWNYMKKNAAALDPAFEKKTTSQQIRHMLGHKEDPSKTYRIKLGGKNWISVKREENLSAAENGNAKSETTNSENMTSEKDTSSDS